MSSIDFGGQKINWYNIISEAIRENSTKKLECAIQEHGLTPAQPFDLENSPPNIAIHLGAPSIAMLLIESGVSGFLRHKDIHNKKSLIIISGADNSGEVQKFNKLSLNLMNQKKVDLLAVDLNQVSMSLEKLQEQIASFISPNKDVLIIVIAHGKVRVDHTDPNTHFIAYHAKSCYDLKTKDLIDSLMRPIKEKLGESKAVDFLLFSCYGSHATKDAVEILPPGSSFIGMGIDVIYSPPSTVEALYSAFSTFDASDFSAKNLFFVDSLSPLSYAKTNNKCATTLSKKGEFYSLEKMAQHTLNTKREKLLDPKIKAEIVSRVQTTVKDGIGFPKLIFNEQLKSYKVVEYMTKVTIDVLSNSSFSLLNALESKKHSQSPGKNECEVTGMYGQNFEQEFLSNLQGESPSYGKLMLLVLLELHEISGELFNDSSCYLS